ncbi:MAG TPA: HEAT repeat domain-containing protein [Vicinamibacterales bacterium]|nr:HEAT repeat domain-containing protein [Vicinamibacterales bacterium]
MSDQDNDVELLGAEESTRIIDLARACKAAARAVLLYPPSHPAIAATLGRIVQTTSAESLRHSLKITVLPDQLQIDGRKIAREDQAVTDLAVLLHDHLIGEMVIQPGGDREAWLAFLQLLGRSSDSIRSEGGIARVWTTMAGRHIELREIDYSEVLRERKGGYSAAWDSIIKNCLEGMASFDDSAMAEFLAMAGDAEKVAELMAAIENSSSGTIGAKSAAVMRMIRGLLQAVTQRSPEQLAPTLGNVATAVGQLTPDMVMGLLTDDAAESNRSATDRVMDAVLSHMPDKAIAGFVSRNVIADGTATDRLAQAFQALVSDTTERERLLTLTKDDVAASPLGSTDGFDGVWSAVAEKLLKSYSDKPYISDAYARELSSARTQAIAVERVSDDPPERVTAWLSTVSTTAVRTLDISLLLDLLRIEQNDARWGELMTPVVRTLEDLLLVGDFDAALSLIDVIAAAAAGTGTKERRQHAMIAIDMIVAGPMMQHIVIHLGSVDDQQFGRVKSVCLKFGEVLVKPLAEALAAETRGARTRERLTDILLAFGAVAKRTIERLKNSANAAVRRTAVQLMRQFGGSDALPELKELLDDTEPQVQREAVRAILNVGSDQAFQILQEALKTGSEQSRNAIMQSIGSIRDERATPLVVYIVRNVDYKKLTSVYLRAIEQLGALKDPEAVQPLAEAFRRPGEWWAPRRTSALRSTAAAALARIGTNEAFAVLEEAVNTGPRGLRNAARPHLRNRRPPPVQGAA